jgi:PKD repeat protein
MKWYFVFLIGMLLIGTVSAYDISYATPGTYDWVCPANTTLIFVQMAGGGGSGKSTSWWLESSNAWGYGGSHGEYGNITMVPVTPGVHYPIVVGAGGATSVAYGVSNAGGTTTAFGYTKLGGAGGLSGSGIAQVGGAGESTGFWGGAYGGVSGGTSGAYTGGAGGTGVGSGGGGAGSNASLVYGIGSTTGGAGAGGAVGIWDMNGSGANVPYYTANPTTTGIGTVVTFTDESLLHDSANLTYDWDFGDGTAHSTTLGTVTHVYTAYGTYTTNLTITSDIGVSYLSKTGYISITSTPITAWYTQKLVRIKAVDAYGNDLEYSNISISYISNSLPSKDVAWLSSAFGISQSVATQMVDGSIAMQGYAGSDGSVTFMMFPAIQYGITITNLSIGLSKYTTLYPQDNDYIIYCPLLSQIPPESKYEELVNSTIYVSEPNTTHITFTAVYQDTTATTTNVRWNVTNLTSGTVVKSLSWGVPVAGTQYTDTYTFPSTPSGIEYQATMDATRSGTHDYISVSVMTKGASGRLIPLGIENFVTATQATYLYNLISVCIILFIAAMSGPRSESAFTIIVPIFAGIFMFFGWLRLATPSQTTGLFYLVVIMGVFGVLMYMNDQNKEKYGTVGPGSKLFNVAVFLALFTASLTLASGFSIFTVGDTQPVPGTCAAGTSCDTYGNFDFTTTSSSLQSTGGLNIASAAGWMVDNGLKMAVVLINVIVGVFAFPLVLNGVLNGIAPGISTNATYLLFLAFLELLIVFVYVFGAYEFFSKAPAGSTL